MADTELKTKWLEALRSGEFRQGKGRLRYEDEDHADRFCCLGVLCQLADIKSQKLGSNYYYGDSTCTLPNYLSKQIGIMPFQEGDLIRMNDKEGKSFSEIADWIEENL